MIVVVSDMFDEVSVTLLIDVGLVGRDQVWDGGSSSMMVVVSAVTGDVMDEVSVGDVVGDVVDASLPPTVTVCVTV